MSSKNSIVMITDDNFVMQTIVALLSLFANKKSETIYNITILGKNLSENNIKELKNLSKETFFVNILSLDDSLISDSLCTNSVYSSTVLYKLKLDKIFQEYDKLLFLDSDIIVLDDLTELYNTNINDYYIAGAKDISAVVYNLRNKNKLNINYFNTGVMLLNLKRIRDEKFFEKAIKQYFTNAGQYFFPEQDVLNEIIGEKIKIISIKYNYITSITRYTKKQLANYYNEDITHISPVILHYAGGCRPWIYYNIFKQQEWNKYYKISQYKNCKLNKIFIPFLKTAIFIINQYKILTNKKIYRELGIIK